MITMPAFLPTLLSACRPVHDQSGSLQGEGEHKLMALLLSNMQHDRRATHVVYSADSDALLLAMQTPCPEQVSVVDASVLQVGTASEPGKRFERVLSSMNAATVCEQLVWSPFSDHLAQQAGDGRFSVSDRLLIKQLR
jgi:XRN 5'-3' exonuclease N-terminus